MPQPTRFVAAIVKGLVERGDPYRHFGSLGAFREHQALAEQCGLVAGRVVTPAGHQYYTDKALAELPDARAYAWPVSLNDAHWSLPGDSHAT